MYANTYNLHADDCFDFNALLDTLDGSTAARATERKHRSLRPSGQRYRCPACGDVYFSAEAARACRIADSDMFD